MAENSHETKSTKSARIPYKKWTEKMCLIPPAVPLSATGSARAWRGLVAPPAGHEEDEEILLKGMSGKPEEFFKVDRRS